MRPQDVTRAHALDASLSCGHFYVDVFAPAVGGWNFLTPATTCQLIKLMSCSSQMQIQCVLKGAEMMQTICNDCQSHSCSTAQTVESVGSVQSSLGVTGDSTMQQCSSDVICIRCSCLVTFQTRLDKEDSEQRKLDAAAFWMEASIHQLQTPRQVALISDRAIQICCLQSAVI